MDGLEPGVVFADRYVLTEPLRRGASAQLWRALDRETGDEVALKLLDGADAGRRLEAEFARLRAAQHPAVVRALDVEPGTQPAFLVLELVEGPELRASMGADYRQWLPRLREALDGLAAAHAAGVPHGDLSLHNVVIGDDGRARLIDFGARGDVRPADDVRAVGEVIFRLLTGTAPGGDPAQALVNRPGPEALKTLAAELLSAPARYDIAAVKRRLDELLHDLREHNESFERIAPAARRRVAPAPDRARETRRAFPWLPFAVVGLIATALVVAVVAWSRLGIDGAAPGTGADAVSEAGTRLELQREQSETLRARVYEQWLQLESMDVDRWAGRRAEAARDKLADGERHASAFETLAALRELREADALMSALLEEAPAIAAFHRAAGQQALQGGDAQAAAEHFRTVLAIEPADEATREALARTAHLDDVLGLVRAAREAEASGALDEAVATLREAARIDPEDRQLQADIARLETAIAERQFGASMSAVYAALGSRRFRDARAALARAERLRPDAAEVRDARTQLRVAERDAAIRKLRERAEAAEAGQDWEQAIALYAELLQLDEALVFAQQGRDRARRLASLTARANALLESTEFEREQTRRQATQLVEQIATVQASAPALRDLGLRLEQRLALARQPVAVQLQSDNQTEVTIYRVGRIGRFANHELELVPGRYTVVGVRDGFRDVRLELVVPPGEPVDGFVIRCEERI